MDRVHAPAERPDTAETSTSTKTSPLGCVPHQLRGQMYQWKTQIVEGEAFDRCTGCSDYVSFCLFFFFWFRCEMYQANGIYCQGTERIRDQWLCVPPTGV